MYTYIFKVLIEELMFYKDTDQFLIKRIEINKIKMYASRESDCEGGSELVDTETLKRREVERAGWVNKCIYIYMYICIHIYI
jgi:hypothetical protein